MWIMILGLSEWRTAVLSAEYDGTCKGRIAQGKSEAGQGEATWASAVDWG